MPDHLPAGSCELSFTELSRLHRGLIAFGHQLCDPGVLAIGLGPKEINGKRSPHDPLAARFLVGRKRNPRRAAQRIPPDIDFRMQRSDGTYTTVTLPTDVEETGGPFVRSGTTVQARRTGTTGLTVAWLPRGQADLDRNWQWGLYSVGHLWPDGATPHTADVRRLESGPHSPAWITGTVRQRTAAGQPFDAAVIEFPLMQLALSGFVPAPDEMLTLRNELQLATDAARKAKGKSLRAQPLGARTFRVKSFHPEPQPGALGNLMRVLVAEGQPGDFAPGTSGSVWLIDGVPAAIQIGAFEPDYRLGVGQSLISGLVDWAGPALQADLVIASHVF